MNAPQSFERTHVHGKEPVRYFTPASVGQHLGMSPGNLLQQFNSGKIEQLQVGDYIYKPTASRPGPSVAVGQSGLDKMDPIQKAAKSAKSAKIDLSPEQRKAGVIAYQTAKGDRAAEKPVKKAADAFDEQEWTGHKPLDKPAPDRDKFLKTGEVSEENQKKQGFWSSMKDRLKFAEKEKTEQELADEKAQEYLGRQMGRERLPGYDEWKTRTPEEDRARRGKQPVKKSADTAHGTETIPIVAKPKIHPVGTSVDITDNDVYGGESGVVHKVDPKADYPHQVRLTNGTKAWFHGDELKPSKKKK